MDQSFTFHPFVAAVSVNGAVIGIVIGDTSNQSVKLRGNSEKTKTDRSVFLLAVL